MSKKNKKRIISLIMAISIIASAGAPAAVLADNAAAETEFTEQVELSADLTYGDWTYSVRSDGTVAIEEYNGSDTDVTIPSEIDGKSVTEIGVAAFWGCTSLKSVTIPHSVTCIGGLAFAGCTSLKSVTIPYGVTEIGDDAFDGCTSLESVTIPDSVTYIAENMFNDTALYKNEDNWENGVLYIGNHLISAKAGISGDYSIKSGTVGIAYEAFEYCASLESVTIPHSVTRMGNFAFRECISLKSVTIPSGIIGIDDEFDGCTSLESVTILNKDTDISNSAFSDRPSALVIKGFADSTAQDFATSRNITFEEIIDGGACGDSVTWVLDKDYTLTISGVGDMYDYDSEDAPWQDYSRSIKSIVIEDGVTSYSACKNAIRFSNLESISIADSVTKIGNRAFFNCVKLSNLTLPSKLESLGNSSFDGYSGSVIIPASTTHIGTAALPSASAIYVDSGNETYKAEDGILFTKDGKTLIQYPGAKQTTEYTVPDSVTELGQYAFYINDNIENVTIASGVSKIANYNFRKCNNLKSVTVLNKDATFGSGVFTECPSAFVVKGYAGSTADSYASENSLTFETLSDNTGKDDNTSTSTPTPNPNTGKDDNTSTSTPTPNPNTGKDDNASTSTPTPDTSLTYSGIDGTVVWSVSGDTLTIGGSEMKDYTAAASAPWLVHSGTVKKIVIGSGVKNIGSNAFNGMSKVTGVSIPNTVTVINSNAFEGCTALEGVTLPESLFAVGDNAFKQTAIKSLAVPNTVFSIGQNAFDGCDDLTEVTLPFVGSRAGVSELKGTFSYVFGTKVPSSLKKVTITNETFVPESAFANCKDIENICLNDNVSVIGKEAFSGCESLKEFTIPQSVTKIEDYTFKNCKSASEIVVTDKIGSIGEGAFDGCKSLVTVYVPKISAVKNYTFRNCSSLKTIDVPNSVESIGQSAFEGCTAIAGMKLPFIGSSASEDAADEKFGYFFGGDNSKVPSSLTKVEIDFAEAGYITDKAFADCKSIKDILISNARKVLDNAFENCTGLKTLCLPERLSDIGETMLSGCTSIETLTVPFIGADSNDGSNGNGTPTSVLGGFFGYDDSKKLGTKQYYSDGNYHYYKIPKTLKNVQVLGQAEVPYGAFMNCDYIEKVTIVSGNNLYERAFAYCKSLKSVTLPDNMTSINDYAFAYCTKLETINIPKKVKNLGESIFYGATALKNVVMPNNTDLQFAEDLFNGTNLFTDDVSPAADNVNLFADGVVFTCAANSAAYNYAISKGIATNVVPEEKLNVRKTATTVAGLSDSTYLFDVINTHDDMKGILHVELYDKDSKKISEKTMATEDNVEYRVIFTNEQMKKASYAKIYVCNENGNRVSDDDEVILMGEDVVVPTENGIKIKYANGIVTFETSGTIASGAVLIETVYNNADGTMVKTVIHDVDGADDEIAVSAKPNGSSAKLMLWDGIKTMKALAETEEY